jgi:Fe-S-cluster-containing dehydrogenase component
MKKLLVDLDVCIGCTAHGAACNRVNHDTMTFRAADLGPVGLLPVVCRHCEDPACVQACPRDAMRKEEDGTVRRSSNLCSGCQSCVLACPFGVLDRAGGVEDSRLLAGFAMSKCHLCFDRVAEGKVPACVATCPTGALKFEEMPEVVEDNKKLLIGAHTLGRSPYVRRSS